MCELLVNVIATVIGGLLLTLFLFLLNEYGFPKKNLTGEWETSMDIENTSHPDYLNLKIVYKIHLLQKGYKLSGSGEKIKDIRPGGEEYEFERKNRVIIDIDGYYERKFFKKSMIYLNVNEEGRVRETRATYFLILVNKKKLTGTFLSTAADSSGKINMEKI